VDGSVCRPNVLLSVSMVRAARAMLSIAESFHSIYAFMSTTLSTFHRPAFL